MLIQYLWFALVVVMLAVGWQTDAFKSLLNRVTKFSAAGVDFEFNPTSAQKTKDSVESSLRPIKQTIDRAVEADVRARSLQQVFGTVLDSVLVLDPISAGTTTDPNQYRATIHIPDPMFENWLYQVLDYHPKGLGHGRRFDSRGGIIGLAWRTGKTELLQDATELTADKLVSDWSMTHREAAERKIDDTRSLLAVVLTDTDGVRRIGILYLDSNIRNRFGASDNEMRLLAEQIAAACKRSLAKPLTEVVTNALMSSPQLLLEKLS